MNEDIFRSNKKTKELEILRLIIQAKTNDEIGDQLFINHQTVGVHQKKYHAKTGYEKYHDADKICHRK